MIQGKFKLNFCLCPVAYHTYYKKNFYQNNLEALMFNIDYKFLKILLIFKNRIIDGIRMSSWMFMDISLVRDKVLLLI